VKSIALFALVLLGGIPVALCAEQTVTLEDLRFDPDDILSTLTMDFSARPSVVEERRFEDREALEVRFSPVRRASIVARAQEPDPTGRVRRILVRESPGTDLFVTVYYDPRMLVERIPTVGKSGWSLTLRFRDRRAETLQTQRLEAERAAAETLRRAEEEHAKREAEAVKARVVPEPPPAQLEVSADPVAELGYQSVVVRRGTRSLWTYLGLGLTGLGVVSLGYGGYAYLQAAKATEDYRAAQPDSVRQRRLEREAARWEDAALGAVLVGGAAVLFGGAAWWLAPTPAVRVEVSFLRAGPELRVLARY